MRELTRYIPNGATVIRSKTAPAIVYAFTRAGSPYAIGYSGKAAKPAFHHRFRTDEQRAKWIAGWFERETRAAQSREQRKKERRERLAKPHGLQIGDVLSASWGYDQTNIDYFEVVALHGARTVEVCEIAAHSEETGFMQGESTPRRGAYIGAPMRRKIDEWGGVRINACARASKLEPIAAIDGTRVYGPSHWTAYA